MKRMVLLMIMVAGCLLIAAQVSAEEKSSSDSLFRVKMLIDDGLENNLPFIKDMAKDLSESDRLYLYQSEKKDAGLPFALNLILGLGIGSYVQGDTSGGTTALVGELGSLMIAYTGANTMNGGLLYGGTIAFLGFRIYELIRPFSYKNQYNRSLSSALDARRVQSAITPEVRLAEDGSLQPGFLVTLKF